MNLKRAVSPSKSSRSTRFVRAGLAGLTAVATVAGLSAGCLDRPVSPLQPNTSNVFVTQVKNTAVDKIDLLFMIDNSISMADKQAILQEAVPVLVTRLVDPVCVAPDGSTQPGPGYGADCPGDTDREFEPLADIHIGIVSSSLGGYGADLCDENAPNVDPTVNDQGHLIGAQRGITSYEGQGFLAWDPEGQKTPPGMGDVNTLVPTFQNHVVATGEVGCGFEASLEAWYRFLVDPAPPAQWTVVDQIGTPSNEVDQVLLNQRANFLRPDSLVAIIMLTDENDCSINPRGQGWLTAQATKPGNNFENWFMPRGTAACNQNPNSPCCRPCASSEQAPPEGCSSIDADAECSKGHFYGTRLEDSVNLRCYDQKRRFGVDFLYPTARYVNALSQLQLCPDRPDLDPDQCDPNAVAPNPLFVSGEGGLGRDPDLVFLAGIVGVPWQDIATEDSKGDPNRLDYLTAAEILDNGVWDVILGKRGDAATAPTAPTDPHMIETPDVRPGLPGPGAGVMADPIHGHEFTIAERNDLQYACIFPLAQTVDCAGQGPSCDCSGDPSTSMNPLCQDPATGAYGNVQHFAKAYPGRRELRVLQDFGNNSIVASICPKVLDPNQNDYGYNPAVDAISNRLIDTADGTPCLPRKLQVDANGDVQCLLVESRLPAAGQCQACSAYPNRSSTDSALAASVQKRLEETSQCGGTTGVSCETMCFCNIDPFTGTDLETCRNEANTGDLEGYCYIDAEQGIGNPELVAICPESGRQMLRFVGWQTPGNGTTTFIACRAD